MSILTAQRSERPRAWARAKRRRPPDHVSRGRDEAFAAFGFEAGQDPNIDPLHVVSTRDTSGGDYLLEEIIISTIGDLIQLGAGTNKRLERGNVPAFLSYSAREA